MLIIEIKLDDLEEAIKEYVKNMLKDTYDVVEAIKITDKYGIPLKTIFTDRSKSESNLKRWFDLPIRVLGDD